MIFSLALLILLVGAEALVVHRMYKNWKQKRKPDPPAPVPPPGTGITLMVPFKTDYSQRLKCWNWLHRYYSDALPGAQIVIGENNQVPWCKTAAVNVAFRRAIGDVVVILDADCYIDTDVILRCAGKIRAARVKGHKLWFVPYRRLYRLTQVASDAVVASDPAWPYVFPDPPPPIVLASDKGASNGHWFGALIQILPHEAFALVGGMDERFQGWGGEDIAFMRAVDTLYGKHKTSNNQVFHLWHPTLLGADDIRMWPGQLQAGENGPLAAKYHAAFGDRAKMRKLVDDL